MDGEVKKASVRQEAWNLCKEFIGGPWAEIPLEEFRLFEVRGGQSNILHRCALPEGKPASDGPSGHPRQVLLRTYGVQQVAEGCSDVAAFVILSERRLGPKLYGVFPTGRLEEFIPSHSLSSDEQRKHSASIAREMAKIHALNMPVRKVPEFFERLMRRWLAESREIILQDKDNSFFPLEDYEKEFTWLSEEIKQTNSPVVYCHNDLTGGNVLYREDSTESKKSKILFIDFECGAFNYRTYDIANNWSEWCFDYDTPASPHFQFSPEKFPSRNEQIAFCTEYLDQLRSEGVALEKPLKEEVEGILKDAYLFAAAGNLLWSTWSAWMISTGQTVCKQTASNDKTESADSETGTSAPSSDDRYWREKIDAQLYHKEHSKARKEQFQRFKKLHLETLQK